MLSGNAAVISSMIGEMTDSTNQGKGAQSIIYRANGSPANPDHSDYFFFLN